MRKNMKRERNSKIVVKYLDPYEDYSYRAIGKMYGISTERVRQILRREFKIPSKEMKQRLLEAADKFRCPKCGKTINGTRTFCSWRCGRLLEKYAWNDPKTCFTCKVKFYPHRNHKFFLERKKVTRSFCSTDCYFKVIGKGVRKA
jgi:predicted RNA-binding Zn-ribbon protein involved in translation (DUF1610 family)